MHADNDLEYFSYGDVQEMAHVDAADANLVLLWDRNLEHTDPMPADIEIRDASGQRASREWAGTKVLLLEGRDAATGAGRWLQVFPASVNAENEVNMDSGDTLRDFVATYLPAFPADRCM